MSPSPTTALLALALFATLASAQCPSPLIPRSSATIAAPALDVNNTYLREGKLYLKAGWPTVAGRTLEYSGIGPSGACIDSLFQAFAYDDSSPSCRSTLGGSYLFNFQLMTPACAAEFSYQNTGFYTTVTFPWEIRFNDVVSSTRGAITTTYNQAHTVVLLITITFPNQVTASTADGTSPRIFSNESVAINAIITSQTVANSLPYNVSVLTQLGRSFSLVPTSVSMSSDLGYGLDDLQIEILQSDTFSASGTRTQYWRLVIIPNGTSCRFSGNYSLNFQIVWAGQDDQGNPLSADQNPLGVNPTATVELSLESIDFCSNTIADKLTASLQTFQVPPLPATIYEGIPPSNGFFTNARLYFQGKVTSENLALKTTSLTELFITDDDGLANRRDLVLGGLPESELLAYIPQSLPAAQIPGSQALFSLISDPEFFPVLQDQDQVFIFNALFSVQYQLPSGLGKRDFRFGVSGSMMNSAPRGARGARGALIHNNINGNMKRSLEQQIDPVTAAGLALAVTTARVGISRLPPVPTTAPAITIPAGPTREAPLVDLTPSSSAGVSTLPSLVAMVLAIIAPNLL